MAGPNGSVWSDYEMVGGAWSGWHAMSGRGLTAGPVAVGPGSNGSLQELFVAGPNGSVWSDYEMVGGAWSGWHAMSGRGLTAGPVAVGPGSNGSLQELFVAGPNGSVWSDYEMVGGAWSGWHAMSGRGLTAGPVAVGPGSNGSLQELFVAGPNGSVWSDYEMVGGAWSGWHAMSGRGLTAGPVAVGPGSNGSLQELFVAGPNGSVWSDYEMVGGAWSGWHAMSGRGLTAGPVAVGPGSNGSLQELFVAGPNGSVWSDYEMVGGAWSGWHAMSGSGLTAGPVAVGPGSNGSLQELFVPGPNASVWGDFEVPSAPPGVITPVGSLAAESAPAGSGPVSLSVDPQNVGDLMLLGIEDSNTTLPTVTGVSGGGSSWRLVASDNDATYTQDGDEIWEGVVTATGSSAITITLNGFSDGEDLLAQEFSAGASVTWSLDQSGKVTGTSAQDFAYPSLTPAGSNELYFGIGNAINSTQLVGHGTPGVTYISTGLECVSLVAYDTNTSGTLAPAVANSSGSGNWETALAVLVQS